MPRSIRKKRKALNIPVNPNVSRAFASHSKMRTGRIMIFNCKKLSASLTTGANSSPIKILKLAHPLRLLNSFVN